MAPPLEQHGLTDQLEPGGELQIGIIKHRLQLIGGDVGGIANLVGAGFQVDVGLDEEDVVH